MQKNMIKEINLEDYVLTNIDLKTGYFTIRLKDNEEYIVYYRKIKGRKQINFIIKNGKEIPLSYEVLKAHLSAIREYRISGI